MEQKKMIEHKQTAILDPASNQMVEVDEGIAPLLKVWIEFSRAKDAEAFLTRVISGLREYIDENGTVELNTSEQCGIAPVMHSYQDCINNNGIINNSVKINCLPLHIYDMNSTSGGI